MPPSPDRDETPPNEVIKRARLTPEIGSDPPAADVNLPPAQAPAVVGDDLVSDLNSRDPEAPPLEAERVKTTTDTGAGGEEQTKKKVRKLNRKGETALTGWDSKPEGDKPRRVKRSRFYKVKRRAKKLTLSVGGVALLCLIVYGIAIAFKKEGDPPVAVTNPAAEEAALEISTLDLAEGTESRTAIEQTLDGFLASATLEERLKFVRQPDRVRPLMEAYHSNEPVAPIETHDRGTRRYHFKERLLTTNLLALDFSLRPIAFERIAKHEYRVDWESFVGHCDVPWSELPSRRPTEPFTMRAMVTKSAHYDAAFDEEEWSCWQLNDLGGKHQFFGYTQRHSDHETEIAITTRKAKDQAPLTLRVAFSKGGKSTDQLEISEFLANGWVLTD